MGWIFNQSGDVAYNDNCLSDIYVSGNCVCAEWVPTGGSVVLGQCETEEEAKAALAQLVNKGIWSNGEDT